MALGPQPARTDRPRTAALRVLRVLAGADGPLTIAELTEALGGHPNTVRAQLDHLVADGYAGSSPQPTPGRGRPAQGFIATLAGRQVAGSSDAADDRGALLDAVADLVADGPDPRAAALALGRAWGARLGAEATDSPLARPTTPGLVEGSTHPEASTGSAIDLAVLLARQGFTPERHPDGLRLLTCPLLAAAGRHPEVVCTIHQGLIEAAASGPVRLLPFAEPGACLVVLA